MTDDLVAVLEELIEAAPGANAYHLRLENAFAERDVAPDEVDAFFASFLTDFDAVVATLSRAWGSPAYEGAVDDDDFPVWSEALVLAYWQHDTAVAFVSLRHDDDNEPMFLEVGALTDDEIATLAYTKS